MSDSITKSMRFDIESVDHSQDMLHAFPELQRMESWKTHPGSRGGELHRDKLMRYLILMYSDDSILARKNPPLELHERKMKAAELAGFERNKKGEFSKSLVDKLFNLETAPGKPPIILDMIVEYLILQRNHTWTEICTTEQEYSEYIRLRFAPVEDDKDKDTLQAAERKNKLRAACKDMIKDLESYYADFYKENSDVKEKAKKAPRMTLENIAK